MKHILFFCLLLSVSAHAQTLDSLYRRADAFSARYHANYHHAISDIKAIERTSCFWYLTRTSNGDEFFLIDPEKQTVAPAFDQSGLAASLKEYQAEAEPYKLPFKSIVLNKTMDTLSFRIDKERYTCALSDYKIVKLPQEREWPSRYWSTIFKEDGKERVKSPDGRKEAYISEGNLWVTDMETKESKRISSDGSPYEYYSSNIYWSPDSKKIVCCRYRPVNHRKLLLISSSPKDQLQPKTEELDYVKPGDALPVKRPVLFFPDEGRSVEYKVPGVESQFSLDNIKWKKDSCTFTFDFNKRGHQQFVVYSGDAVTGELRAVVDEQSPTFVYYRGLYQYWLDKSNELLWISERDGWRHLYLYDTTTGSVKRQLTKGEWIVKSVVRVDEAAGTLVFIGCGRDKNEDPYLEKYYSLNIKSGKITALTPENGNHKVTFSHDNKYMVDSYSRLDQAPVVVVRSASSGKVLFKPEKQPDLSKALADGFRMPEVFCAKGRDGLTDIWGAIIRPTDFDPSKKYPVIEYIYAGPHDSHVPKSFGINFWASALAELGFITVMIDGMGTANRSKAFHDVCWKNLKDAGFPDRIAWMKAAAAKHPEMDIERVGIFGCSAGGQNAMGALLFHPEFYKVGVAACGCHDNRMDKIWWNEQWMGYPVGREYEECSNVVNAHLLKGKLMLILGELDNNVDPSSTLQVVDQLIKHNKEFEFVMLPGERHTMGGPYGERKRRDFFVKHLLNMEPPRP